LHQQRLAALQEWLDDQQLETPLDVLAAAPPFFDSVLRRFGAYLYDSGRPVYTYVYALPSSWDLVALWEQLEPVKHRRPVPQSVFKAMVALAVAWGWRRYAAVLVIIFLGVLRPMEGALATRESLVLPCDLLDGTEGEAYIGIGKPKTRNRERGTNTRESQAGWRCSSCSVSLGTFLQKRRGWA
jgi:hypothetical protein